MAAILLALLGGADSRLVVPYRDCSVPFELRKEKVEAGLAVGVVQGDNLRVAVVVRMKLVVGKKWGQSVARLPWAVLAVPVGLLELLEGFALHNRDRLCQRRVHLAGLADCTVPSSLQWIFFHESHK